jgi:plasmid stabilization system protein ParE
MRFHPEARLELAEAMAWYDDQRAGLGEEFLGELRRAAERILAKPTIGPQLTQHTRHYRLSRFPYKLVYQVGQDEVVIMAVAHLSRKPGYWRHRR